MAGNPKYHAFWVNINMTVKIFFEFQVVSAYLSCVTKEKFFCGTTKLRSFICGSGKPYVYP